MSICKFIILSILLYVVSIYLSEEEFYNFDVENAKERYSRSANTPITMIKQKLFEKKTATKERTKIITTSAKFKYAQHRVIVMNDQVISLIYCYHK